MALALTVSDWKDEVSPIKIKYSRARTGFGGG